METEFSVFCPGVLDVLSIGKGDLRLTVGDNGEDREKARELIDEMLRKGYSIFVETDEGPVRVTQFNPKRMTYVIVDAPEPEPKAKGKAKPAKWGRTREVSVRGSRSTAVGRTAAG